MLLAGFLVDIVQHWLEDWRRGRLCSMGCSECILFASASAGTAVLPSKHLASLATQGDIQNIGKMRRVATSH